VRKVPGFVRCFKMPGSLSPRDGSHTYLDAAKEGLRGGKVAVATIKGLPLQRHPCLISEARHRECVNSRAKPLKHLEMGGVYLLIRVRRRVHRRRD